MSINIKTFVDEIYFVRMYEDQTLYLTYFPQTKMLIKITENTRRFSECDKNFKQSELIDIQTSTAVFNVSPDGCILGVFYLLVYTCVLYA